MLKFSIILLITFSVASTGCQTQDGHPVKRAMGMVSSALHARDIGSLQPLLSAQTAASIDEVFKAMCALHTTAKALPENMRQDVVKALPKSVLNTDSKGFLQELAAKQISSMRLNEQTTFGLQVDSISQESAKSAGVVTKSGEIFPFSLEKSGWKIHLFKESLTELLKETRKVQQAVNLTVDRIARRAQIESVLQTANPKQKARQ